MRRPPGTAIAALCAAVSLATSAGVLAAPAQTKSASQLKREQARETERAKALKAQATAAKRDEADLAKTLAALRSETEQTQTAAVEAEARAAALDVRRENESTELARDRRAFDVALIALLQRDGELRGAPPSLRATRAARLAGLAAPALAASAVSGERRVAETAQLRLALSGEQEALAAQRARLAATQADQSARLAETAKRHAELLAQSDAAARRAAALGRQAKTLAELASKTRAVAAAGAAKTLARIDTGPRQSPAAGKVLVAYGAQTREGPAKGLTVRTAPGAKVVAPGAGTIGYAGEFRSYGQVVIIDQADGSSLVLTGLHSVLAQPGKKVSVGEPVGQMAAASASSAPDLYFEVRQAGRTVDPERWLRARS